MKLIEKMAEEFNKKITTHYLHGGIGDLPDTVEKVWMAGFRAAIELAAQQCRNLRSDGFMVNDDKIGAYIECANDIDDLGENEVTE